MTHDELVRRYAARQLNQRTKEVSFRYGNISCREEFIYSYDWYELAKYLGTKDEKSFFIKNGDMYSRSTSTHQGLIQNHCPGPTVSKTALEAAGFAFRQITMDNIIDVYYDYHEYNLHREKATGKFFKQNTQIYKDDNGEWRLKEPAYTPFDPPKQGMYIPFKDTHDLPERFSSRGYWHTLGGVLLRKGNDYYLCALDEGSYFVSHLSKPAESVHEAFDSLKPQAVKDAFAEGKNVKRQGEWFFIPTGMDDAILAEKVGLNKTGVRRIARQNILPSSDNRSNTHRAVLFVNEPQILELKKQKTNLEKQVSLLGEQVNDRFVADVTRTMGSNPTMARQLYREKFDALAAEYRKEYNEQRIERLRKINHIDDELEKAYKQGHVLARGTVYHSGREHASLKLGVEWHEVYQNTEIRSWSASGRFD